MHVFADNLINWLVLAAAIVWAWMKFMPPAFEARRKRIVSAIDDSAKIRKESEEFLASQRTRIENAEKESERILVEAKEVAAQLKVQLSEQTKKDVSELENKLQQQISTHRQMVITELRSQAAIAAVRLAEASLPGALTPSVKKGLQGSFISQLDQNYNN